MPRHGQDPALHATISPHTMDIAWAAGIFEGEGTCSNTHGTAFAAVGQRDPWILHRLRDLFGGSVRLYGKQWYWKCGSDAGRGFLMTIYVFMSPKRKEQIRKALYEHKSFQRAKTADQKIAALEQELARRA